MDEPLPMLRLRTIPKYRQVQKSRRLRETRAPPHIDGGISADNPPRRSLLSPKKDDARVARLTWAEPFILPPRHRKGERTLIEILGDRDGRNSEGRDRDGNDEGDGSVHARQVYRTRAIGRHVTPGSCRASTSTVIAGIEAEVLDRVDYRAIPPTRSVLRPWRTQPHRPGGHREHQRSAPPRSATSCGRGPQPRVIEDPPPVTVEDLAASSADRPCARNGAPRRGIVLCGGRRHERDCRASRTRRRFR